MELGLGIRTISTLLVIVLSGYALVGVNSRKLVNFKPLKLLHTLKGVAGHLRLLRECRRQLTFIGSTALGAYITRVIKDSPLTPLPLPPIESAPRWNFITLPLHVAAPYLGWMKEQFGQNSYKELNNLDSSWRFRKPDSNSIDIFGWKGRPRFRRDLSRVTKLSPHLIATAVTKTLKSLQTKERGIGLHDGVAHNDNFMKELRQKQDTSRHCEACLSDFIQAQCDV